METGRVTATAGQVIHRRYQLQRLIMQGQVCAVYQGIDLLLQRAVAVKCVPAAQIIAYKAAIRMTSHFSHPNIIGLYDLIAEPDTLYIVQEYVEGDSFAALLQAQFPPHQVADFGSQICQSLIYAAHPSRKVCHGDLIPTAILRDKHGYIRVNNFALPSDLHYFTAWSILGGENVAVSDRAIPWGKLSAGRQADDTRALGLLLYQLLAGHSSAATIVEPPPDGQLRFLRNIPPQLCDVVARTVVRQHPQHISNAEVLYRELKTLADTLDPHQPHTLVSSPTYKQSEVAPPRQLTPSATGNSANALLVGRSNQSRSGQHSGRQAIAQPIYRQGHSAKLTTVEPASLSPAVSEVSHKLATPHRQPYPQAESIRPKAHHFPIVRLLALCLLLFILFFVLGYFAGNALFPGP